MEPSAWAPIIAQLPLLAAAAIALGRGLVVVGRTHDAQMADKDKQIAFVDGLRLKAEDRAERLAAVAVEAAATLKELVVTVDRALDLAEASVAGAPVARRPRPSRGGPGGDA